MNGGLLVPVVVGVDQLVREQLRQQHGPVGGELVGAAHGVEHAAGQREAQRQRVRRRLLGPRVAARRALVLARVRQVVLQLRVDRAQQALLHEHILLVLTLLHFQ